MLRSLTILRYAVAITIVVVVGALVWWYFFLDTKQDALNAVDAGRGTSFTPPTFGGAIGNTSSNIVANITSFVGTTTDSNATVPEPPRLWRITQTPVAGIGFSSYGTSTMVRFVERGTGYVFEANPKTGAVARITNTLEPRVYEALLGKNGVVILRSLNERGDILTSAGQIIATTTATNEPRPLSLRQLPANIRNITLNASGEELLFIIPGPTENFSLMRTAWNGTGARQIASLGVSGFQIQWLADNRMILAQHPGGGANYTYELSTAGTLSQIADVPRGAVVLPKSGSPAILYASSALSPELSAKINARTSPTSIALRTPLEKCVWSLKEELVAYCAVPGTLPTATMLEERLRGGFHTIDTWWRVYADTTRAELVETEDRTLIDVENPVIDPNGEYIVFMDARTKSLWLLRLSH